jgi:hypothetical protein
MSALHIDKPLYRPRRSKRGLCCGARVRRCADGAEIVSHAKPALRQAERVNGPELRVMRDGMTEPVTPLALPNFDRDIGFDRKLQRFSQLVADIKLNPIPPRWPTPFRPKERKYAIVVGLVSHGRCFGDLAVFKRSAPNALRDPNGANVVTGFESVTFPKRVNLYRIGAELRRRLTISALR